jgi:hypothetical protein
MIELNKHHYAWKVEASGIKGGLGRWGRKCHGLSSSVFISDQAGLAFIIGGMESMKGMDLAHTSHGRRSVGDRRGD